MLGPTVDGLLLSL